MKSSKTMYIGDRGAPRKSPWREYAQKGAVVLGVLLLLVLLSTWWHASGQLDDVELTSLAEEEGAEPTDTIVAISVGPQQGMDEDRGDAGRLESLLLVQHAPGRDEPAVVVFPADLRVTQPDQEPARLTDILDNSGQDAVVQALEDFTQGISIQHFVGVDLQGVSPTVEALGGIELCFTEPFVDEDEALDLASGCHQLDGPTVDAFVRSTAPHPDFGRNELGQAARRVAVVRAMAAEFSGATMLNPLAWRRVTRAVGEHATSDDSIGMFGFAGAAGSLGDVSLGQIAFRTVPGTRRSFEGEPYVAVLAEQAETLFDQLRRGRVLDEEIGTEAVGELAPGNVSLVIVNGVGTPGLAGEAREVLERAGFPVLDAINPSDLEPNQAGHGNGEWDPELRQLTIHHSPDTAAHAEVLRDHLGDVPVELNEVDAADLPLDVEVVLVVGSGWSQS